MLYLEELRKVMTSKGFCGFIVPMSDEFQSEYVPKYARRVEALTGFTGSSGSVIVLRNKAAFFTDGRYTVQADEQVDAADFEIVNIADKKPYDWLRENVTNEQKIAYDAWLHTQNDIKNLKTSLKKVDADVVACDKNLIDEIWSDQPAKIFNEVLKYDIKYSGQSSESKIENVINGLPVDAVILTLPESVNWLLNIRGSDLPHTPFVLSYAILYKNGEVDLFAGTKDIDGDLGANITLYSFDDLESQLAKLSGKKVQIDDNVSAAKFFDILQRNNIEIVGGGDPCLLPKACKNAVEIDGMRAAHIRDGVALCKFLHWLEKTVDEARVTEISASDKLEGFRSEGEEFKGLSFDTISSYGSNGAIVHYKSSPKTDRKIGKDSLYLLDSGGQYLDGTTDVTRTMCFGEATHEQKRNFTLVLKGHIALASAKFEKGTTGSDLDGLARKALQGEGLDYDHGTGHGVGCYMNVHEGPQRISKVPNKIAILEGMITSNEPGYYKAGEYGIRIESLVVAVKSNDDYLEFETITLAPIEINLLDKDILTSYEINWINSYHKGVFYGLSLHLEGAALEWLKKKTRAI